MLNITNVFHVDLAGLVFIIAVILALVWALMIGLIVFSPHNTVSGDVSKALVHPTSFALIVVVVTVD